MEKLWTSITVQAYIYAPKVFIALLVMIGFIIAGNIARRVVLRIGASADIDKDVTGLVARAARGAFVVFGVVTALGTAGINVSALVAGLGLTGFALGFALKDALSNMLSGVLILVYRPFKPGDNIMVAGISGRVVKVDFRYTTIDSDGEGKVVLIPNSTLFTKAITILDEV